MKPCRVTVFAFLFACASFSPALHAASAAPAQNSPRAPQAALLKNELLKVYFAEARVHDLLGLLRTTPWKMTDAERASFQQQIRAVESQLRTLEKQRYQLQYHPEDASYGKKTVDALGDLIPEVQAVGEAVAHYQSPAVAAQLDHTAQDLSKLADGINAWLVAAFPGKFVPKSAAAPGPAAPTTPAAVPPPPLLAPHLPAKTLPASVTITASRPAVPSTHLKPEKAKALLLKVYLVAARINDLLSLAQPGKWKMTDSERTVFQEQVQAVQSGLANLEKWRYQFSYQLENTELGDKTVEALASLLPHLHALGTAAGQFESPSAGSQFDQPQEQLASLKNSIESYVASLRTGYQRELAAQPPGLQTERISRAAAPPPVQYLPGVTPPLTAAQVKAILGEIYMSVYRIHDLLTQEHPDSWKAPRPERAAESLMLTTLFSRAGEVQKWRGLFSEYPGNMDYAFQTYRSVDDLFQPLGVFSQGVGQYESASLASDYTRQVGDLQARLAGLLPYVSFILEHESHSVALYQSDLATCQNKLSYAMHGFARTATPMKNIVPDFKGRRVRRGKVKAVAHTRSRHATRKRKKSHDK